MGAIELKANEGWVSVGSDHDTSSFCVESIRRWWLSMGKERNPNATDLTITADSGGGNGNRVRLWRYELGLLAQEIGLNIHVMHYPPGTSKWRVIEHKMFSFISMNRRGNPLASHGVMVNLIANTTAAGGLKINAALGDNKRPLGRSVTDEEMASIFMVSNDFLPERSYTLLCKPPEAKSTEKS